MGELTASVTAPLPGLTVRQDADTVDLPAHVLVPGYSPPVGARVRVRPHGKLLVVVGSAGGSAPQYQGGVEEVTFATSTVSGSIVFPVPFLTPPGVALTVVSAVYVGVIAELTANPTETGAAFRLTRITGAALGATIGLSWVASVA